jgi:hypothetical protein
MIRWFVKRFLAIFEKDPHVFFLRCKAQDDADVLWQADTLKEANDERS